MEHQPAPDPSQEPVEISKPPVKAEEAQEQLVAKIKADFEQLYGSRLQQVERSLENQRQAAARLQAERDQWRTKVQQLEAAAPKVPPPDPWTGIEDGPQWKQRIEQLAEQKAEEKLRSWQTEQQTLAAAQAQQQALEASKGQVIQKYPDLDPETGNPETEVSKAYLEVLNAHPDWQTNPYGPLLTMYAMEEQLLARSSAGTKPGTPRMATTALPPSRPAAGESKSTLTREQKAFCERHGLKDEAYLKVVNALESGVVAT